MKIGILTYHDAYNYGAALQAIATCEVFNRYGGAEIINYQNPNISGQLARFRFKPTVRGILRFGKDVVRFRSRAKAVKGFKEFISSNSNLSIPLYKCSELEAYSESLDIVVAGSDQIWNPQCHNPEGNIDDVYFLNFFQGRKFSYASSFGSYKWQEEMKDTLGFRLRAFSDISVREQDGAEFLTDFLGRKVQRCLDPTLLLDRSEWKKFISPLSVLENESYIFVYAFSKNRTVKEIARRLSEDKGLKVVVVDQNILPGMSCDYHFNSVDPSEFLFLLDNASIVLTDSFHGTAFSVNFQKEFYVVPPLGKENRIVSFLESVSCMDRYIDSIDKFDKSECKISFKESSVSLCNQRKSSFKYIESMFL